jgi:hypothetical protein
MTCRSTYRYTLATAFATALVALFIPFALRAQSTMDGMDMGSGPHLSVGVSGIGEFTRVSPALNDKPLLEGYLTQPNLMLHADALHNHLALYGTLNGEGLTLKRGELDPGAWGEGYVDRRHPHTYLHELMVSGRTTLFGTQASLSAGKGFPAFGTDDPMTRPFVKYPVNHHLSQILERYALIGGVRRGMFMLEGSLFNGDEPTRPGDFPDANHFGDSRALRATVVPFRSVEAQVSHAFVTSPENDVGHALDQRKWSASVRYGEPQSIGDGSYALLEWSRTQDVTSVPLFTFRSVLAEAAARRAHFQLAVRYEDTTRPEEERLPGFFRVIRPANDFSIIGTTRWRIAAASLRRHLQLQRWLSAEPFLELERAKVSLLEPNPLFDPATLYGSTVLWTFSFGARIELGAMHMRMGRYGVADSGEMSHQR